MECLQVRDDMIGGHYEEHRVSVFALERQGGDRQCRGRVPADRLQDNALGSVVDCLQLFEDEETVFLVCRDDRGLDFVTAFR